MGKDLTDSVQRDCYQQQYKSWLRTVSSAYQTACFFSLIECPVRFFNWFSIYTVKIIPPVTLYEIVSEQGNR